MDKWLAERKCRKCHKPMVVVKWNSLRMLRCEACNVSGSLKISEEFSWSKEELKLKGYKKEPCPFCGSKVKLLELITLNDDELGYGRTSRIECSECNYH